MIRLDGGLAGAGIEGFRKGSEINIAATVAIRSLGRCGSPLTRVASCLGMVLTDNNDTEPFPSNTIADCQSIPIDLSSGSRPTEYFPLLRGVQCARLFEYRVES